MFILRTSWLHSVDSVRAAESVSWNTSEGASSVSAAARMARINVIIATSSHLWTADHAAKISGIFFDTMGSNMRKESASSSASKTMLTITMGIWRSRPEASIEEIAWRDHQSTVDPAWAAVAGGT